MNISANNKKVCIFLPSLEKGGAEKRMTLLAIGLKKRGHDVEVVVLRQQGIFEQILDDAGVAIKTVAKQGKLDLLGATCRARKIFKNNRYDVILSCLPSANIFAVLVKTVNRKTPLIWGVAAADMPMNEYTLWARIGAKMQLMLSRFANNVIVNSHKAKSVACQQGFNQKRMHVIHNGVDTTQFFLKKQLGNKWLKKLNIPPNEKVIGIVARLDPAKGIETFLQAVDLAFKKDWYFILFGSGSSDYANQLKKNIVSHSLYNKRLFLIENEHVDSSVYNAFDVATISSVSESFPNVMLEAMSCGVPVMSTDVGDCKAVIQAFGQIVAVNNPQAMFDAWEIQLQNELDVVGAEVIREYVINRFSIESMVDKFESVFSASIDVSS